MTDATDHEDLSEVPHDSDRPQPIQTVYEQYWMHVRHVEDEMWSFTRIWAIVITAIFTILGTELPWEAKVGTAVFGAVMSVLGFFIVYALRIPFLDFFLTTEIIASKEFGLSEEYRRLGDDSDYRINKGVDVPDVLIAVYALIAGVMVFSAGIVAGRERLGAVLGVGLVLVLIVVYATHIIPKYEDTVDELIEHLRE